MLTVDPRHRATINDIAEHEWIVAGKASVCNLEGRTPETSGFSNYLESSMEQCENDSDLNSTLKATDHDSMQPKSILKHKNGSGDESPPLVEQKTSEEENLAGKLAVVCGLHAKDSLKLKTKPHSASGKRRVLRSRRDRESGYYSSPERVSATQNTSSSIDSTTHNSSNVPQIKSSLVSGGRMAKLGVKPANVTSKVSTYLPATKECYLMPINPGPDERLTSLSSDDGCSVKSQSRPASTYSDSSILSSDSFDLCTFDGSVPDKNDSISTIPSGTTPKRPSSLPHDTSAYISALEDHSGSLTPKSKKLVRDLQRILGPPGRRSQNKVQERNPERRPRSLDESSHLTSMVDQLNVELDLAYKKGVDICANLRSAEV